MSRIPDFIIAGAMKSGTSSLHALLNQHPEIYIPSREIHFYNLDNIYEHTGLFVKQHYSWVFPDFQNDYNKWYSWYCSFFSNASNSQLIGEDSTTYLTSYRALRRIYNHKPETKFIILLRNPADRSYSHYWHNLRKGRTFWSFDDSLRLEPFTYLNRSMYKPQVENLLNIFASSNVIFLLYEEFFHDVEYHLRNVLKFLDVDPSSYPFSALDTYAERNISRIPKFIRLETYWNRFMYPRYFIYQHIDKVPLSIDNKKLKMKYYKTLQKLYRRCNPLIHKRPPPMSTKTRVFLNNLFKFENAGLDRLIAKDTLYYWYV